MHITHICIDDNGRVICIPLSDHFEINKVKEEEYAARVSRYLASVIEADIDADAILMIKVKHEDALLAKTLLEESEKKNETDEDLKQLTPRELEVHYLIGEGLTNKEISKALNITVFAVKGHIQNIFSKLQIHSRSKIIAKATKKD